MVIWPHLATRGTSLGMCWETNYCDASALEHYSDAIMSAMASQITGVYIVCSTSCCWGGDDWKRQSSVSRAFVMGKYRWPVDSTQKGPVTRKVFPFHGDIMKWTSTKNGDHGIYQNKHSFNLRHNWITVTKMVTFAFQCSCLYARNIFIRTALV